MKGRALRRALKTNAIERITGDVPLIVDSTELITPERAYELLLQNTHNRPIVWSKVEEYAEIMRKGEWALHSQGIILDNFGNLLTGQKRLWAIIYAGVAVYMRISRGTPAAAARVIDRGQPQSARDLASRATGRKHSPTESSLARASCALAGSLRPTKNELAERIETQAATVSRLLAATTGTKKTPAILMVMAVLISDHPESAPMLATRVEKWAEALEWSLAPQTARACWGHGAAFGLAMNSARLIVSKEDR